MPEATWTCSKCGQIYPMAENACPVCHITRENRHIVGKIEQPRTPKPPPDRVEVPYPFFIKEVRFNLPLDRGAVWSSGRLMIVAAGIFLLSEKDPIDAETLAQNPPAGPGPIGPLSIFVPRDHISRIIHHRLTGEFLEVQGRQKIPLRCTAAGWTDLDVICDQMGIPRS